MLLFAVVFPILTSASSRTTTPLISPEQFRRFRHLTVNDGLSQNLVIFIHQDRRGFMWFGTAGGLDRYDGVEFKHYRTIKGITRQPVYFYSCLEQNDSTFWLGTDAGLLKFNPITNTGELEIPSGFDSRVSTIALFFLTEVGNEALIFGMTELGLLRFDIPTKTFSLIVSGQHVRPDKPTGEIVGITPLDGGRALILSMSGLMMYDDHTRSTRQLASFPSKHTANCMWMDRKTGILWIGTTNGLLKFADNTLSSASLPRSNLPTGKNISVESLFGDTHGTLWIGTSSGLLAFTPVQNEMLSYANHPADPFSILSGPVVALFEDRAQNLWMSIHDQGVSRLDLKRQKFGTITNRPGYPKQLNSLLVSSIIVQPDGNLWIAADGLHYVDRSRNTITEFPLKLPPPASASATRVMRITSVNDSVLYIITEGRIYVYDTRAHRVKELHVDGRPYQDVRRFHILPASRTAICFLPDSIVELDLTRQHRIATLVRFGEENNFPRQAGCTSILADQKGTIWFGTNVGLFSYDRKRRVFRRITDLSRDDAIPPGQPVLSMALAANGILWIGTDSGLRRFDPATGATRSYTVASGLPNDKIWCTLADSNNSVWLGTNRGLVRLREEASGTHSLRVYTPVDGLPSNEFSMGVAAMDAKGTIYFGTSDGVVYWLPSALAENPHLPPVVLTQANMYDVPITFGQDVAFLNTITIPYDKKVLSFSYAALDFTDPARNQYAYMLKGYDEKWNDAGTRRQAFYTNLDPGEYTFRVKASNNDGVWNDEGLTVRLTIVPPFWMTWWFRGLAAIGLLGIAGGAIRYVELRKIKARLARLEQERAMERERTRISQDMHDELGANLTSLSMITEIARRSLTNQSQADEQLRKASDIASETVRRLDEIVWAVNPKADNLANLAAYISEYAQEFFSATPIRLRFEFSEQMPHVPLASDVRHSIFLVVKEALNNIVKHSCASEATIGLAVENGLVVIAIRDNGKGFDASTESQLGNGIRNMRQRIESVGGKLSVQSSSGSGTIVRMEIARP
jgi:signal transduction histidine kinase/ligand-binding sensor domain-containing protein